MADLVRGTRNRRPSHLQKPEGPKVARTALTRRAMRGRPQEVLCSAHFFVVGYNGIGALW